MKKTIKYQTIKLYKYIFNLIYSVLMVLRKNKADIALIVLSREKKMQGNLQFIYRELATHLPTTKIHLVETENKMNLQLLKEIFQLSKAKYIILDDYYLPIYLIKPNDDLKIIQLWHAAGAFKKFGYSTVGTNFGPDTSYLNIVPVHSNYTHVYVSSKRVKRFYAEAFNMSEEKIFPLGIPRIDMFQDLEMRKDVIEKIYHSFPALKRRGLVNVLIAPTYRADGVQTESNFNIVEIIANMVSDINEEVRILFKPHPYMDDDSLKVIENDKKIIIVREFSINEWMLLSDAFITDYSSSIFDYSLLKRPLAHFVPDINSYEENRGFYENITEISDGNIIKGTEDLIKWINGRKRNEYYDTSRMIEYNFDNTQDVSRGIVKHFI